PDFVRNAQTRARGREPIALLGVAETKLVHQSGPDAPHVGHLGVVTVHVPVLAIVRTLAVIAERRVIPLGNRESDAVVVVKVIIDAADLLDERVPAVGDIPVIVAEAGIGRAGIKLLQSFGYRVEATRGYLVPRKWIAHGVAIRVLVQRAGIVDPGE